MKRTPLTRKTIEDSMARTWHLIYCMVSVCIAFAIISWRLGEVEDAVKNRDEQIQAQMNDRDARLNDLFDLASEYAHYQARIQLLQGQMADAQERLNKLEPAQGE